MPVHLVREIMTPHPQCCTPEDTVASVALQMAAGSLGAVPVVQPQSGALVGIITDRDITCRCVTRGADPSRTPVREGMSPVVAALGPEASIHDCLRLMKERGVRRIPVVDGQGVPIGIVTQDDLARAAARGQPAPELVQVRALIEAPPYILNSSRAAQLARGRREASRHVRKHPRFQPVHRGASSQEETAGAGARQPE